jgi:hypothetical protein
MPYGSGQRLGETIDPRFMQADYSGFTNAAAITGNALANIGQQIGDTIKKRNENEKEIAGGIKMATAMKKAVPALGSMADEVIDNLSNADHSTNDKLLALAGVKEAMQMSLLGNQERRADVALKIQQDELAAKIAAAQNKETVMVYTPAELDSFRKAGYDPKIVGRDQFGNLMVETLQGKGVGAGGVTPFMKDGVFGFAPQNPSSFLPTPGASNNFPNGIRTATDTPITGVNTYPDGSVDNATPAIFIDGAPGVLPPLQGTVQQSPYAQRVINDVNNGFAFGTRTGAPVTPPPSQTAASVNNGLNMGGAAPTVAPNQINGFNPNNITAEQAKLLQAVGEDKLIPSFDSNGQITAYAIPGTPAEQQQKLNSLAIKKAELDAEGEKRKNEGENEKKLRLEDYKNSQANAILYNINNALTDISKVPQGEGFAGGAWRAALGKYVPNSSVAQLDQSLETINNVIASDSLYKMRISSPTGGALGNTSNADIQLLKNSIVSLNSVKDPKKLQEGLYVVQMRFLDTIHGTESERKAKLKSGDIDQESFDYVESLYPPIKINDRGQAVPRETKEINIFERIEINPEIQKMLNQ